jgi:carboxyl-terminal processing protease
MKNQAVGRHRYDSRIALRAGGPAHLAGVLALLLAARGPLAAQPLPTTSCPAATPAAPRARPDPLARATFDSAVAIIGRTYFDSTFRGVPWAQLADSLRPIVEAARERSATRSAIRTMLDRLGESHFAVVDGTLAADAAPEATEMRSLGVEVRWIEASVTISALRPDGPGARAGLRRGSRIVAVNGCALEPELRALREQLPAALVGTRALARARELLMPRDSAPVRLTVDTGRATPRLATVTVAPAILSERLARLGNLGFIPFDVDADRVRHGDREIGVIRFTAWVPPAVAPIDSAVDRFRDADGIIIDLRGNLGGIGGMVMGVGGHFIDSVVTLGTMRQRSSTLRFVTNPRRVSTAGVRVTPYAGPLAILIDPQSLSTSEFFAGAMQAVGRARLFGERTGGMALPAIAERLPNGDLLYHAIADFVDAGNRRLEGIGVTPDVAPSVTRAALLDGADPVYDAAIAWMRSQPRSTPTGPARR